MAWKDELNNAKKVFKTGTTRDKVEYIWEYYKWHILVVVFVVYFIGSVIYNNVTAKEYVLQGIFLNTLVESETVLEMEQDFIKAYPIDTSSEEFFFFLLFFADELDFPDLFFVFFGIDCLLLVIIYGCDAWCRIFR